MRQDQSPHKKLKAWVVFSGQTDLPWLRLLKPGFRHCYVLLNDGEHWFTLDPLSNYIDLKVHNVPAGFDLPLWLEDRGHQVISHEIARPRQTGIQLWLLPFRISQTCGA